MSQSPLVLLDIPTGLCTHTHGKHRKIFPEALVAEGFDCWSPQTLTRFPQTSLAHQGQLGAVGVTEAIWGCSRSQAVSVARDHQM